MKAEDCPSDFQLDRYTLDELDEKKCEAIELHLAGCEACGVRFASMARSAEHLNQTYPTFSALDRALPGKRTRATRLRTRFWPIAPLLGAVAGLSLWWTVGPGPEVAAPQGGLRSKGTVNLSYHIKRGNRVFEGGRDESLMPGEAVQFGARIARAGYFAVLSLDGRGEATVYYPLGTHAASLPAGDHTLPLSTILDEALGTERVWGMLCDQPFELAPLRDALQEHGEDAIEGAGCQVDLLSFHKGASGALE